MKLFVPIAVLSLFVSGCSSMVNIPEPEAAERVLSLNEEFAQIRPPASGKLVAAVYDFKDKTGQRKPSDKMANISTAVTQGAESHLIKALIEVGGGEWFTVVERVSLENLTKERQIIRQARQSVKDETPLKPMLFAGVIIDGGIIGYDSNVITGGAGARHLGIGASTQYRQDIVTITMRMISTQTGEVLISTSVTKSIISTGSSLTMFKFFDLGTKAFELEAGNTVNEPVNYAVRVAIEQAVVELIKQGEEQSLWKYKD